MTVARLDGTPLDVTSHICRLPSLIGRVSVSFGDGEELTVPLFDDEPLIFKMRKNWTGVGRRVTRITTGFFIVIAPDTWSRIGNAPVEPGRCSHPAFRAHFFHRDRSASLDGTEGFDEWNASPTTGIELTGALVHDDADDGPLYVGDVPTLEPWPEVEWARVGAETESGWAENFRPSEQSLSDVLAGKEGRFFLRVYGSDTKLTDSVVFRYIRDLMRIEVDGATYNESTALVPKKTGYKSTEVRFVGADGSSRTPVLPPEACQTVAPSGAIAVPPRPDADRVSCELGVGSGGTVNVVLDLPRIWWRVEDSASGPGDWCDTPLVMTRAEFRKRAYADGALVLLSNREASLRAGFDQEREQPYSRKIEDDHIAVPLEHFVDYDQIDQRLSADSQFNVEWAKAIVPTIVVSADPMPEVVSFAAKPAMIRAGDEAILEWRVRNAVDARIRIEPDVGVVEPDGIATVHPSKSTRYTLTTTDFGIDELVKAVTLTVVPPGKRDGQLAACVLSSSGAWRRGKGFSTVELRNAGLTTVQAARHSIVIDRRRRTSHSANVDAIRSLLDG